jgi:voltage-dependent calcium channel T type alpha-1G
LFKGKLFHCIGNEIKNISTKADCLNNPNNKWINSQFNFDNLGNALLALFVFSSTDGWMDIMYSGIDAVGVDKQPIENYNEWMIIYFISFLLLVGFFLFNTFVGVVIENFHKCRANQRAQEKALNFAKRYKKLEKAKDGNYIQIYFLD